MRKTFIIAAILQMVSFAAAARAGEVAVTKILRPSILEVDRRPDKAILYSRCVGVFKTGDDESILTGVKFEGDRVCPAAGSVKLDVTRSASNMTTSISDNGDTKSEDVVVSPEVYARVAAYKGKNWVFGTYPSKVTVKVSKLPPGSGLIEDSFYIVRAVDADSTNRPEALILACDDASSLKACMDSRLETKKPLAIGNAVAETNLTKEKSSPLTHK